MCPRSDEDVLERAEVGDEVGMKPEHTDEHHVAVDEIDIRRDEETLHQLEDQGTDILKGGQVHLENERGTTWMAPCLMEMLRLKYSEEWWT